MLNVKLKWTKYLILSLFFLLNQLSAFKIEYGNASIDSEELILDEQQYVSISNIFSAYSKDLTWDFYKHKIEFKIDGNSYTISESSAYIIKNDYVYKITFPVKFINGEIFISIQDLDFFLKLLPEKSSVSKSERIEKKILDKILIEDIDQQYFYKFYFNSVPNFKIELSSESFNIIFFNSNSKNKKEFKLTNPIISEIESFEEDNNLLISMKPRIKLENLIYNAEKKGKILYLKIEKKKIFNNIENAVVKTDKDTMNFALLGNRRSEYNLRKAGNQIVLEMFDSKIKFQTLPKLKSDLIDKIEMKQNGDSASFYFSFKYDLDLLNVDIVYNDLNLILKCSKKKIYNLLDKILLRTKEEVAEITNYFNKLPEYSYFIKKNKLLILCSDSKSINEKNFTLNHSIVSNINTYQREDSLLIEYTFNQLTNLLDIKVSSESNNIIAAIKRKPVFNLIKSIEFTNRDDSLFSIVDFSNIPDYEVITGINRIELKCYDTRNETHLDDIDNEIFSNIRIVEKEEFTQIILFLKKELRAYSYKITSEDKKISLSISEKHKLNILEKIYLSNTLNDYTVKIIFNKKPQYDYITEGKELIIRSYDTIPQDSKDFKFDNNFITRVHTENEENDTKIIIDLAKHNSYYNFDFNIESNSLYVTAKIKKEESAEFDKVLLFREKSKELIKLFFDKVPEYNLEKSENKIRVKCLRTNSKEKKDFRFDNWSVSRIVSNESSDNLFIDFFFDKNIEDYFITHSKIGDNIVFEIEKKSEKSEKLADKEQANSKNIVQKKDRHKNVLDKVYLRKKKSDYYLYCYFDNVPDYSVKTEEKKIIIECRNSRSSNKKDFKLKNPLISRIETFEKNDKLQIHLSTIKLTEKLDIAGAVENRILKIKLGEKLDRVPIIVIDPGHGGKDPGAVSKNGTKEKDINLEISKKLKDIFTKESDGKIEVYLTRDTDKFISLRKRSEFANKKKADIFLSIHANFTENARKEGVETFFLSAARTNDSRTVAAFENAVVSYDFEDKKKYMDIKNFILFDVLQQRNLEESQKLAAYIQTSTVSKTSSFSRGVKQAGFYVLFGTYMPSILIETGFLSNLEEEKKLKSPEYQLKMAKGIHYGIKNYLKAIGLE